MIQTKKKFEVGGHTAANSVDLIDEYCNNPSKYERWQLREAINDAKIHYESETRRGIGAAMLFPDCRLVY